MIIPSSTVIVISFFKFRQSHLQINKVMRSCRYTSISVIDSLISSRSHRSFSAALLKLLCRVRFVEKVPTAEEDQETMEMHQFESYINYTADSQTIITTIQTVVAVDDG